MAPRSTVASPPSEVTADQVRSFHRKINQLINQAALAEDTHVQLALGEVRAVQADLRTIAATSQPLAGQLADVDRRLAALEDALGSITDSAIVEAGRAGAELVDVSLDAARLASSSTSANVVDLTTDRTAFARSLVRQRVADIRSRMTYQLQRLTDPDGLRDVLVSIGTRLQGSVVVGRAAADTAAIVRTQMGDAHGATAVTRGLQVAATGGPVLLKRWELGNPKEPRSRHIAAAGRYAAGIPLDEPFVVGRYRCQHPRGRGLPGVERINCRCRLALILVPTEGAPT